MLLVSVLYLNAVKVYGKDEAINNKKGAQQMSACEKKVNRERETEMEDMGIAWKRASLQIRLCIVKAKMNLPR